MGWRYGEQRSVGMISRQLSGRGFGRLNALMLTLSMSTYRMIGSANRESLNKEKTFKPQLLQNAGKLIGEHDD
jgi:hypothetical protein